MRGVFQTLIKTTQIVVFAVGESYAFSYAAAGRRLTTQVIPYKEKKVVVVVGNRWTNVENPVF